ncbi:protein-glutamine gamma-glutamyltransferase K-like [Hemitrygon akajei]|uniref:protein-glutamine gamma-glutamyltransferase K-like n=1 Tax=Hemitrygon akajei TaxID=2704970 RepID=UPI003BF9E3FE
MTRGTEVGRRPEAAIGPGTKPAARLGPWQRCLRCLSDCSPCLRKSNENYDMGRDRQDGATTAVDEGAVQQVTSLDLQAGLNKERHHTQDFDYEELIIRRGFPFQMGVTLNSPFDPNSDPLQMELSTGNNPQLAKRTLVVLTLGSKPEPGEWALTAINNGNHTLAVTVHVPADCPIGRYRLSVSARGGQKQEAALYILFNPWCPADVVYMEGEKEKAEYVLNESGRIYYGTEAQIGVRTWNFGQFSRGILEASLKILQKSQIPVAGWGNAISVVRTVSAMVNSQDDAGVLVGNWSGDYSGGTSPTSWVGSVEILLQYLHTGRSVCYGQCWVFSGVTTTVLRCLGIPARPVTNFSSAHDTDVSLTTDVFLDEDLKPLEEMNYDSIWNFHVWNDCWMSRPDLPAGHGGWQAVDATPQETSSGIYCCGPASLEAIRNGLVYLTYDAPFIFAEVNSDKVYWQRQTNGQFQKLLVQQKVVGHNISTKAVGSDEREDITLLYKYQEGSDEERIAVETACRHGSRPNTYEYGRVQGEVGAEVSAPDGVEMGQDFALTVKLRNSSDEARTLVLFVQAAVMFYTGVCRTPFHRNRREFLLEPNQEMEVKLDFRQDEYLEQLVDQAAMMFTVTGRVRETGEPIVHQLNFRLRTPDLVVTPLGEAVVGKAMKVEVRLKNPLPIPLSGVLLRFEGAGLQGPKAYKVGSVPRQGTVTVTETLLPCRPGHRKLVCSLDSPQLTQVHGVAELEVREA